MTSALTFTLTCPDCGVELAFDHANKPTPRRSTAVLVCSACQLAIQVVVKLRVCDGARRRYDAARLERWILDRNDTVHDDTGEVANTAFLANRLGITARQVIYMRQNGLDEILADRYATYLGIHPCEIWPDWFNVPADELVDA